MDTRCRRHAKCQPLAFALFLCLLSGCTTEEAYVAIINKSGDKILDCIQKDEPEQYADKFNERQGDEIINWKTGKVIPEMQSERPALDEKEIENTKTNLEAGFQKTYLEIVRRTGPAKSLRIREIHYWMDSDAFLRKYGIIQFDFVLTVVGENGTVFVQQAGCGLVKRGIVVTGPIEVISEDEMRNLYASSTDARETGGPQPPGLVRATQPAPRSKGGISAEGMTLIPAGSFTMGDNLDGVPAAMPTVAVTVSAFYMDVNLVSYRQWQSVYHWAARHGYGFVNAGSGKAANHPVQTVDWYDAVKWCNARSQQAGLRPVYYADAALTQVYTNGETEPFVNWTNSGYRLPTEAEWERAARGGLDGQRFPWGNTIRGDKANYYGETATYSYDLGPEGNNPAFKKGEPPYTSPVGYFEPNGYGLYDMAGNVFEWCWDWFGTPYAGGSDPHGPASGSSRILRGGSWTSNAVLERCATRAPAGPTTALDLYGFRCVRGQ